MTEVQKAPANVKLNLTLDSTHTLKGTRYCVMSNSTSGMESH